MRLGLLLLFTLATPLLAAPRPSGTTLDDVLADNASLRDVAFVDADRGWAVGDRGVILRTSDGGNRWHRVPTPTSVRLDGVAFLDANRGWAVGGSTRPYTHESRGVVLATTDGGRRWEIVSTGPLPRLRVVEFFDNKHGIAAGDGTALHPSGLFKTDDGGRHWQPIGGGQPRQWLAADFTRDRLGEIVGAAAGLRGATTRLTGNRIDESLGAAARRGGYGVALVDEAHGWLVGDGGLIRRTDDGGAAWTPPLSDPPQALADWFDYRAVATHGGRVWIAGSPGSLVVSSDDGGETWHTATTGISTPITAITFTSETHGWAVGEFGVVLTTRNGGRSWRVQRGEGRRAATAFVVSTPSDLPTELLTTTAAADGYRSVVRAPLASESHRDAASLAARLTDSAVLVGADAVDLGWSIPMEPADASLSPEALRRRLDRVTDARTHELLVHAIHKLLVTYRPDVLTLPATGGAAPLLEAAALEAARRAAAAAPPVVTGIGSWELRRAVTVKIDDGSPVGSNEARQSTGDFSAVLGATPSQWRREARGLLSNEYQAAPAAYRWSHLLGKPLNGATRSGLLAGFTIQRNSDTRRPAAMPSSSRLEQLRRLAGKRRNMERLLAQAAGDPNWAGQVVNLTGGLDAAAGSELLSQLATGYREAGRYELAADTLYLLARRYPDAPLADAALLWLVQYYASGERAHADSRGQGTDANPDTLANLPSQPVGGLAAPNKAGVLSSEDRLERAASLIGFLEQARPGLFAEPALRFAHAATQRARGFGKDADKTTLILSKRSIAADWKRAAGAERWLAKPEGLPPEKPLANCRFTPRRPKLDGQLDDPAWSGAEAIRLSETASSEPNTTIRFAHDEAFLYLAVEAAADAPAMIDNTAKRPRDAELSDQDRVVLRIDTDRDYASTYDLTLDARGWTHDSLWGDRHWKPTWYVAADTGDRVWRAEAAVPLSQLADPEHVARAAWAVSLRRLRPGQPPAAWPANASSEASPDAFGLLLFD